MLASYTQMRPSLLQAHLPHPELLVFPFCRLVSRLEYKPDLFFFSPQAEKIRDLLATPSSHLSWEECCDRRAIELLNLKKDHYYISYSGGIDSTNAFVAILKNWPAKDLEKISVVLSVKSIEENPNFFERYVAGFPLVSIHELGGLLATPNSVIITGELADQLAGSDILGDCCVAFGDESLRADYRQMAPRAIELAVKSLPRARAIFARLHPIVEECPFPVRTTHDFFWWYSFSQKWQTDKLKFMSFGHWNLNHRCGTHVFHFFDTPYFQQWSLENHDLKIQKTWASYKFKSKEYIFAFTGDRENLSMVKIRSFKKTFIFTHFRGAITDQWTAIDNEEELLPFIRPG